MNVIGGSGLAAGILLLCAYGVGQQMQAQTATAAQMLSGFNFALV